MTGFYAIGEVATGATAANSTVNPGPGTTPPGDIDATKVSARRIVAFPGNKRVVTFPGNKREVTF